MAYGAHTLQFADESRRIMGITVPQWGAVVFALLEVKHLFPALLRGEAHLAVAGVVWLAFFVTHGVRREPHLWYLLGYAMRRTLGPTAVRPQPYVILEIDGYTRDALTEEQQDIRLVGRLQHVVAALGPGASLQIIVTNESPDRTALIARERAQYRPFGWRMGELADRTIARLATAGLRENDLHFYIVLYEPRGWDRLAGDAGRRLGGGVLSSLSALWSRPQGDASLLDDLVAETRKQLAGMGLSARTTDRVVGTVTPLPKTETRTTTRLEDGRYASSFGLLLPPGQTDPGYLDPLVMQPGPYAIAIWVHGLDPDRERARLAGRNRHTGLEVLTATSGVGEKTEQFRETEQTIMRLRQPGQAMLKVGVYLTFVGATAEEASRKARRAMLVMRGPVAARPALGQGHQLPLALSTGPGGDAAGVTWRMDAETVANMYPFNRSNPSTQSSAGGIHLGETERGERVALDFRDESLRNALCVIFGLSGMGKTSLVLKLCKEWLLRGKRVVVLDGTSHYRGLCRLAGGVVVRTAAELDAVPDDIRMIVVDVEGEQGFPEALRDAVDRKYTGPDDALVIEEAWQLEYMDAAYWVNKKARRGRHLGGPIWWVTHDPEDLLSHKVITSMFSAAAVKITFALDEKNGVASRLGPAMGLTPREISTVKALGEGECYIMRHNKKEGSVVRGAVHIHLSPEERWLFVNDPRMWQTAVRDRAIAEHHGDVWAAVRALTDDATLPFDGEGALV